MTPSDLSPLLRDFYVERLAVLQRHVASARLVHDYDIKSLLQGEQQLFVDCLLERIYVGAKLRGESEGPVEFVVIDEADVFTTDDADHIVNKSVKELRKFGVGMVLAGQSFEHFPTDLLTSASVRLVLGCPELFLESTRRRLGLPMTRVDKKMVNPLSGIRGAAQLLESSVSEADRELTVLIRDEADRIRALVDRMEVFDDKPIERRAVNIHRVLEHVRRLAQSGFAPHLRFVESYDPSLPPVWGNRDQLVQVLLNLVKNAAEAIAGDGGAGEITLSTAYQHGVRLAVPGSDHRQQLPLVVTVRDNGPGITEDMRPHLFEPFVTSKPSGSGLGLALVAKIVGDHGGLIEVDSRPGRTDFRLCLPVLNEHDSDPT